MKLGIEWKNLGKKSFVAEFGDFSFVVTGVVWNVQYLSIVVRGGIAENTRDAKEACVKGCFDYATENGIMLLDNDGNLYNIFGYTDGILTMINMGNGDSFCDIEYEKEEEVKIDKNKIIFSPIVAKRYLGTVVWFFDTFNGVGLTRGVLRIIDEEAVYPYSSGDGVFHRFIIPDSPAMREKSRLLDEHELNALVGKVVTHNGTGNNYIVSHFIDGRTPKVFISGLGSYDSEMLAEQFNINGKPIRRAD